MTVKQATLYTKTIGLFKTCVDPKIYYKLNMEKNALRNGNAIT